MTIRKTTDKSPVIESIYSNMKMLTNKEIKEIAMRQSAEDIGRKKGMSRSTGMYFYSRNYRT